MGRKKGSLNKKTQEKLAASPSLKAKKPESKQVPKPLVEVFAKDVDDATVEEISIIDLQGGEMHVKDSTKAKKQKLKSTPKASIKVGVKESASKVESVEIADVDLEFEITEACIAKETGAVEGEAQPPLKAKATLAKTKTIKTKSVDVGVVDGQAEAEQITNNQVDSFSTGAMVSFKKNDGNYGNKAVTAWVNIQGEVTAEKLTEAKAGVKKIISMLEEVSDFEMGEITVPEKTTIPNTQFAFPSKFVDIDDPEIDIDFEEAKQGKVVSKKEKTKKVESPEKEYSQKKIELYNPPRKNKKLEDESFGFLDDEEDEEFDFVKEVEANPQHLRKNKEEQKPDSDGMYRKMLNGERVLVEYTGNDLDPEEELAEMIKNDVEPEMTDEEIEDILSDDDIVFDDDDGIEEQNATAVKPVRKAAISEDDKKTKTKDENLLLDL